MADSVRLSLSHSKYRTSEILVSKQASK